MKKITIVLLLGIIISTAQINSSYAVLDDEIELENQLLSCEVGNCFEDGGGSGQEPTDQQKVNQMAV